MRAILLGILFAGAFFMNASYAVSKNVWEPPFFNGVAAQVEKTLITYDDLRREMAPYSAQVRAHAKDQTDYDAKMQELYEGTLARLVERALIVAEFNAKGFKMPAKDVDNEYRRTLKEEFNDKTSDLVAALQQQGLTITAYRKRMEESLMVQALQQRFRHDLPQVTPDQVVAFYNQNKDKFAKSGSVKLSVITFAPMTDEPLDVILQTAKEVKDRASKGEDFGKLVKDFNQSGTPDWGWMDLTDLAPEVKEALVGIKVGQVAEPVTLENAKVILVKLVDRKDEGVAPLNDVRGEIEQGLFEQEAGKAYAEWIAGLKKKYFVQVNG